MLLNSSEALLQILAARLCLLERKISMNSISYDSGFQTINEIYGIMQIDQEWSIRSEEGFTWWGHQFRQKIWTDTPLEENSISISRIHVETDFLKYPKRSESIDTKLAMILTLSSLSGLVHDSEKGCLKWYSRAFIHQENEEWLRNLISLAAIMQLRDAEEIALLSEQIELQPNLTSHPDSGPREDMDGLLAVLDQWIIPEGQKPITKIAEAEFNDIAKMLNAQNILSTASESGLAAYIPFGRDVSLIQVNIDQPHPQLGNGILLRLNLPPEDLLKLTTIDGSLIMEMNCQERNELQIGHFMGSWCLGPVGPNSFTPVFVSFIPAVACNPTTLFNMVLSMLGHNTWAEEYFFAW